MTDTGRRAVFLDVDGTIMQDGHYIPPTAAAAIRSARLCRCGWLRRAGCAGVRAQTPFTRVRKDGSRDFC